MMGFVETDLASTLDEISEIQTRLINLRDTLHELVLAQQQGHPEYRVPLLDEPDLLEFVLDMGRQLDAWQERGRPVAERALAIVDDPIY